MQINLPTKCPQARAIEYMHDVWCTPDTFVDSITEIVHAAEAGCTSSVIYARGNAEK